MTDFRWAILGTGVVARKFAFGLPGMTPAMQVTTVASRRPEAAREFVRSFPGARAAPDYAAAAADPDVDAVYIATPPAQHEAHALMAIAAGKAVLVEKPFAQDGSSARRIADAARAKGVFCMEAMWTRFLPFYAELRTRLADQPIGELRALQASFMGSDIVDARASVFDPERGGGALMHRGVYGVSLACHLMGPVSDVQAMGRIGSTGVDEDCTVMLRHRSGALSTIMASLRAPGRNDLVLAGTEGRIEVAAPLFRPRSAQLLPTNPRAPAMGGGSTGRFDKLRESGFAQRVNAAIPQTVRAQLGGARQISAHFSGNGYGHEAAAVAEAVRTGITESPVMPLSDSVAIMDLLDRVRAQIHSQTEEPGIHEEAAE